MQKATQDLLRQLRQNEPTPRTGEAFGSYELADGTLSGRAVPYGVTMEIAPGLRETFRAGTFRRQVKDPSRVKVCYRHGEVIAQVDELHEQPDGLYFTATVPDELNPPQLRHRLIDELSIGFNAVNGGHRMTERDGVTYVEHHRARLMEISVVPWGAYERHATLRAHTVDTAREAARAWLSVRRATVRA